MRLAWVHAVSGLTRWEEEVHLLVEESRRVFVSFGNERRRWLEKVAEGDSVDQIRRGYSSYAKRQAKVYGDLEAEACRYRELILKNYQS